jgi:hypothetical protein
MNLRQKAQGLDPPITKRILSRVCHRPAMKPTTPLLITDLTAGRVCGRVHLAHFLDIGRHPPKIVTDEKDADVTTPVEHAIFHVALEP